MDSQGVALGYLLPHRRGSLCTCVARVLFS